MKNLFKLFAKTEDKKVELVGKDAVIKSEYEFVEVKDERSFSEIVEDTQAMLREVQVGLNKMNEDMTKTNNELRKLQKEFIDQCAEVLEILKK